MISHNATEPALASQEYVTLCRPKDVVELDPDSLASSSSSGLYGATHDCARIVRGEILVAVPSGYTGQQCCTIAQPILKNPKVLKLLQRKDPLAPKRRSKKKKSSRHGSSRQSGSRRQSSSSSRPERVRRSASDSHVAAAPVQKYTSIAVTPATPAAVDENKKPKRKHRKKKSSSKKEKKEKSSSTSTSSKNNSAAAKVAEEAAAAEKQRLFEKKQLERRQQEAALLGDLMSNDEGESADVFEMEEAFVPVDVWQTNMSFPSTSSLSSNSNVSYDSRASRNSLASRNSIRHHRSSIPNSPVAAADDDASVQLQALQAKLSTRDVSGAIEAFGKLLSDIDADMTAVLQQVAKQQAQSKKTVTADDVSI